MPVLKPNPIEVARDQRTLISWYRQIRRTLPWRVDRNPYRIWVSEVMLQQTTVAAVVPFYERFMKRFPDLTSLAEAPLADAIEYWAGLGYYSRARNLHKAAQILQHSGFPQTAAELQELPGFGPYTSRAVASLAFDEKTGVLDGNVIRVLSRRYGTKLEWWKKPGRAALQKLADQLAQVDAPADLNQGLMELGAMLCTPQSPSCTLCPWAKVCVARSTEKTSAYPLKRPRRARELWLWKPTVIKRRDEILLIENTYAPFLKGHWILPGQAQQLKAAPPRKTLTFKGTVTHHDILVSLQCPRKDVAMAKGAAKWVKIDRLKREVPASLIRRAIEEGLKLTAPERQEKSQR